MRVGGGEGGRVGRDWGDWQGLGRTEGSDSGSEEGLIRSGGFVSSLVTFW